MPSAHDGFSNTINTNVASQGIDIEADIIQKTKKMLFAPDVIAAESKQKKFKRVKAKSGEAISTSMPGVFRANSVQTSSGEYGYIRIYTFSVDDPERFVNEFIELIQLLPPNGLIIDVRGNGGGHIYASEGLLQTLTHRTITPEPTQFMNSPLNYQICNRHKNNPVGIDLGPWVDSMSRAVETGSIYSSGFPITPEDFANEKGQQYHGPIVLITDARCYSATDIFTAGFKDHKIGHILGVDENTGAGGANVWTHGLLKTLLSKPAPADPESPYTKLPKKADMRVAIRRTLRVGDQSGTPVEDIGVTPDSRHYLTKNDLVLKNKDLINKAGKILKSKSASIRTLNITTKKQGTKLNIHATTVGISRLDIYIDARPVESININDGEQDFSVVLPLNSDLLEIKGFTNDEYVAAQKLYI